MPCNKLMLILLSTLLSSSLCAENTVKSCRPTINPQLPQFIVGYGSLMQEKSKRDSSDNVSDNTPIYLKGFTRGWMEQSTHEQPHTTYLGVKKQPGSKINAVYFQLQHPADLLNYDKREGSYCRELIPKKAIETITSKHLPLGQYWIYTTIKAPYFPSSTHPIIQSYVDKFLVGCIELEEKYHLDHFARDCIKTTKFWSTSWVNDRLPTHTRILVEPNVSKVDVLIQTTLRQYSPFKQD